MSATDSLASDVELVRAALDVHAHLDAERQLERLAAAAAAWSGASCALALGLSVDRASFVPQASSVGVQDRRFRALTRVDCERMSGWAARPATHRGFGPLSDVVSGWPGEEPGTVDVVPLRGLDGDLTGVLLLLDRSGTDEVLERIGSLVDLVRPALSNAVYVATVRELVIKDDTAACFNRRHFEESLPEELSRARRFRSPVSLIFLDMDNLKQVNNEHGHSMGSRTLWEVSARVRAKVRKFDKLFRFGGDEFCIVLPETEWHGAFEVAERVREAIASRPFLEPELGAGKGVGMTASLGVASFPLHARDQRELVRAADKAMQKVKNDTKNAIGIAEISGGDHDG